MPPPAAAGPARVGPGFGGRDRAWDREWFGFGGGRVGVRGEGAGGGPGAGARGGPGAGAGPGGPGADRDRGREERFGAYWYQRARARRREWGDRAGPRALQQQEQQQQGEEIERAMQLRWDSSDSDEGMGPAGGRRQRDLLGVMLAEMGDGPGPAAAPPMQMPAQVAPHPPPWAMGGWFQEQAMAMDDVAFEMDGMAAAMGAAHHHVIPIPHQPPAPAAQPQPPPPVQTQPVSVKLWITGCLFVAGVGLGLELVRESLLRWNSWV